MQPGTEIFRQNVIHLRKQKKYTQEKLAERAEISAREVSKIERGQVNPTLSVILSLARGLEVEPQCLFDPSTDKAMRFLDTNQAIEAMLWELNRLPQEDHEFLVTVIRSVGQYISKKQVRSSSDA